MVKDTSLGEAEWDWKSFFWN